MGSTSSDAGRPPGIGLRDNGTVLVVDDDRAICDALRLTLEDLGYAVITAHDGIEALALFLEHRPALILTDLVMPGKDGIELMREIRRERAAVKIVAMSGGGRYGRPDYVRLATKLGADAGIRKPFNGSALHELLVGLQDPGPWQVEKRGTRPR